jgi:hypothetical protein
MHTNGNNANNDDGCESTERTNETADSRPTIEVPDDFSLEDALRQQSTTPRDEQPRCPQCGTINIAQKVRQERHDDGRWKCNECNGHFDDPLPPRGECRDTEQTELGDLVTDGGVDIGDTGHETGTFESRMRQGIKQLTLARREAPDQWYQSALASVLDDTRELYRIQTGRQLDLRQEYPTSDAFAHESDAGR